jgi:alanine or glycine:cation symporter, AGCS family
MALLYLGTALVILFLNLTEITPALKLVFTSAFGAEAAIGGTVGYAIMKTLTTGFDRAIFATDAGTGTVPILQAGARTKDPVIVGVVALVSPLLVMIVCTTTALVLIITGAYSVPELKSTNMVAHAFGSVVGQPVGSLVVIVALVLFGYTTALAWASCLERAVGFLFGQGWVRPFQLLYIIFVPIGAVMHVDFVWILADISLSLMVVINFIGVAGLSKEVIGDSQRYFVKHSKEKINEIV